jgi:hypothetical protein
MPSYADVNAENSSLRGAQEVVQPAAFRPTSSALTCQSCAAAAASQLGLADRLGLLLAK